MKEMGYDSLGMCKDEILRNRLRKIENWSLKDGKKRGQR